MPLALFNSLGFALLSSFMALVLGLTISYAIHRANWRWLDSFSLLPLSTSAVTLGLAYLIAFPRLAGSFWSIVIAHSLVAFPLVVRGLLASLRALAPKIIDAGRMLGSSPLKLFMACGTVPFKSEPDQQWGFSL
ncbi:MAG: hypothetical protein R2865_08700 [Deinococcales bacterium]